MAVPSGTYQKYDAKGLRESLDDVIHNISPHKTPLLSSIPRKKAKQTLEEWQTDSLAAVDTANAHVEGDDASYTTPAATVRVGNYTQISRKTLSISGTLEVIDKAGRKSEENMQLAKRGRELKRDQEGILFMAQGGDAGGAASARKLASLNAWVKTNVDKDAGGGNPAYTSGVPGAARTDGTQRALTETIVKAVMQSCYTNGAEPTQLYVGPVNKQKVSGFSGIAEHTMNLSNGSTKGATVMATVDVYVSDFGALRVLPHRWSRERDAWFIDPEMLEVRVLRPYQKQKLAKTGDSEKTMLLIEWTLAVKQEAGLGLAADLTTTA